jgi:hypothetical protein
MAHLLCAIEGELNFSQTATIDASIENQNLWTRLCFPSLAYFEKKHVCLAPSALLLLLLLLMLHHLRYSIEIECIHFTLIRIDLHLCV